MGELESKARRAELIERDAWLDLFDTAPISVRDRFGVASDVIAGIGLLGCPGIPITEFNRAMATGVVKEPRNDDLDAAVAWLDLHATSWALQLAPTGEVEVVRNYLDRTALKPAGAGWAKFIRTDPSLVQRPLQRPVLVVIADAAMADAYGRVVTEGFGLPAECGPWFAALVGRPSWQCFLAIIDGKPAACGAMFCRERAAWFGVETTLPAYRGRGAQRSIIAAQVRAAALKGATVQTCETARPVEHSEPGFSSYRNQERSGLAAVYIRPNFKLMK